MCVCVCGRKNAHVPNPGRVRSRDRKRATEQGREGAHTANMVTTGGEKATHRESKRKNSRDGRGKRETRRERKKEKARENERERERKRERERRRKRKANEREREREREKERERETASRHDAVGASVL